MDVTKFTPQQMNSLRKVFHAMNRFMVFMWKIGLGKAINIWPAGFGRIMVIKHRGRKSGKEYLTPVNYAIVDGEIYCTAGFGSISDWYRNMLVISTESNCGFLKASASPAQKISPIRQSACSCCDR